MANSNHPNHTALTRELHAYLRWRNANNRHPNVLAAQRREPAAPPVAPRTCRVGARPPRATRERCYGLLQAAGAVWSCVLELNHWRWRHAAPPVVGYQQLCRELAAAGPGTFGELDSTGARSVLRRYADARVAAAKRRKGGDPP